MQRNGEGPTQGPAEGSYKEVAEAYVHTGRNSDHNSVAFAMIQKRQDLDLRSVLRKFSAARKEVSVTIFGTRQPGRETGRWRGLRVCVPHMHVSIHTRLTRGPQCVIFLPVEGGWAASRACRAEERGAGPWHWHCSMAREGASTTGSGKQRR